MDQEVREVNQRDDSRNPETVIEVRDNGSADSDVKSNGLSPNEDQAEKLEGEDNKCSSCSIEVKANDLVGENQRICRICHLSAKENDKSSGELMELSCGCRGELGVAHVLCAEAWFRVKGNRFCEICGETAKNVRGISDNGFMEEWNEGSADNSNTNTSGGRRRYLRGQPLCNFLMACLVIAFILPWFFRVNMF